MSDIVTKRTKLPTADLKSNWKGVVKVAAGLSPVQKLVQTDKLYDLAAVF